MSSPGIAIDDVRNWATTGAWKDATPDSYPDWLQVDFNGSKTINEIDVFAVTDDYTNPADPTESTTFSLYGITHFDVQFWTGSAWQTVPNGSITNNNKVITKITFTAITTTKIRVVVNAAQASYSRIVELEAWSGGTSTDTLLGSPESSTNGGAELAQSNSTSIVYNFSGYNHGNYSSIAEQYATFYCNDNWLILKDRITDYRSYPNFISCLPYGFGVVTASFNQPVHNLYFRVVAGDLFVGNTPGNFKVSLHRTNQPILTRDFNTACPPFEGCLVDLREYTNVTRIEMHSVNDINGVGYDDFTFNLGGTPTPSPTPTPNQNPIGALERIDSETDIAHGWARDPDSTSAIRVDFYVDALNCPGGPNSCPAYAGNTLANVPHSTQGNRGFQFSIPARFRDGQTHTLYAHAVDTNGSNTTHLQGSPKTFTLNPIIQSTTFENVVNCSVPDTHGCLDENRNAGGGLRIFSDRQTPGDLTDRTTVWVKAKLSARVSGVPVYFRSFDLDDPSTNDAPVDTNGNAGLDNRAAGASGQYGDLRCPPPSIQPNCTGFDPETSMGVPIFKTVTDNNGEAIFYFSISGAHPGDNYAVATSLNPVELRNTDVNGINLRNTQTGRTLQIDVDRTKMLTAWRELHIEYDSMGTVVGNYAWSYTRGAGELSPNSTTIIQVQRRFLETRRFAGGRMSINGHLLHVDNNDFYTVTVRNFSDTPVVFEVSTPFYLYDDDDFNRDNNINGFDADNGEDVKELPDTFNLMQVNDDQECSDGYCNVFAAAYIRPEYEWAKRNNYNDDQVPFVLNIDEGSAAVTPQLNLGRNLNSGENNDFWVVYVQIGYQVAAYEDCDPDDEGCASGGTPTLNPTNDFTTRQNIPTGGQGSLLFIEAMTDNFVHRGTDANVRAAPHEIGHQLGLFGDQSEVNQGTEFGIMGYNFIPSTRYFIPRHLNLIRYREKSPGI